MEDRVKWIEINGKKILLVDCSNFKSEDIIKAMDKLLELYEGQPENSVLSLNDYTGTFADEKSLSVVKSASAKTTNQLKKGAVVGITGIKKIFLLAVNALTGNQKLKQFDTREEAIKWLTED